MPAYTYDSSEDTETRCTSCGRPLYETELDRWACRVCEDTARNKVTELGQLYHQLHSKLAPGTSSPDDAGHVSGATRSAPLPVSLTVLDLIGPGGVVTKLQTIEDDWRKTLGWTVATFRGNAQQTLGKVIPFISNNIGWACSRYEDVAEDLKLIRTLHQRAEAVINGTRDQRVPVGCCPAVNSVTGQACALPLKVSPWALSIRCGGCGTSWDRDEWLRLGAAMRGIPWPAADLAVGA